jgi:hypothetical protein
MWVVSWYIQNQILVLFCQIFGLFCRPKLKLIHTDHLIFNKEKAKKISHLDKNFDPGNLILLFDYLFVGLNVTGINVCMFAYKNIVGLFACLLVN